MNTVLANLLVEVKGLLTFWNQSPYPLQTANVLRLLTAFAAMLTIL